MSRAGWVYSVMFAALIVGLWAIMRIGTGLRAPPDVSGTWRLQWAPTTLPSELPKTMTVDQSGQYLHLALSGGGNAPPIGLHGRMVEAQAVGNGAATWSMHCVDGPWRMTAHLMAGNDLEGVVQEPQRMSWTATREKAATAPRARYSGDGRH